MDKKGKRRKVRWERGEREERGRHERRDRRAGGGGRSNKAINRDLGIGRQGPGLASLSTPRRAIWLDSINSFYQEVPSTLAALDCCLNRLAWIIQNLSMQRQLQLAARIVFSWFWTNGFTAVGIDASWSKQFSLRVPKAVKRERGPLNPRPSIILISTFSLEQHTFVSRILSQNLHFMFVNVKLNYTKYTVSTSDTVFLVWYCDLSILQL